MAGIARSFISNFRLTNRLLRDARQYSAKVELRFTPSEQTVKSEKLWRNLTIYLCLPSLLLVGLNVAITEYQHHEDPPEFIPYDYLRIRNTKYPWRDGVKSLFHNSRTNPLPDGYEEKH